MTDEGLEWGQDLALLSSTDAVHYGDRGLGRAGTSLSTAADAEGYAAGAATTSSGS